MKRINKARANSISLKHLIFVLKENPLCGTIFCKTASRYRPCVLCIYIFIYELKITYGKIRKFGMYLGEKLGARGARRYMVMAEEREQWPEPCTPRPRATERTAAPFFDPSRRRRSSRPQSMRARAKTRSKNKFHPNFARASIQVAARTHAPRKVR